MSQTACKVLIEPPTDQSLRAMAKDAPEDTSQKQQQQQQQQQDAAPGSGQASSENTNELRRRLANAKQGLAAHLHRKKQLDKDLISLEVSIFNFETSYLTPAPNETGGNTNSAGGPGFGNIVKGYDNYLKPTSTASSSGMGLGDRKRNRNSLYAQMEVKPEERIFSNSSLSHQRVRCPSI